jgi:hypothetical protein
MKKMNPILIGGCDRSGTTLLGALLGVHPRLITVPESQFFINLLRSNKWDQDSVNKKEVIDNLNKNWLFQLWDLPLDHWQEENEDLYCSYSEVIQSVIDQYATKSKKMDLIHWVDHSPVNISNGLTWLELFPSSKFIHLVRDGRAVANSIMHLDWGPNTELTAADWWKKKIAVGLAAEIHLGPERIKRVQYENLVLNPEDTLQDICAFLGINYVPEMIKGDGFNAPRYSKSHHKLVGSPPDESRVQAWKNKLGKRQVQIFEAISGSMLAYLGYELEYDYNPYAVSKQERVYLTLKEYLLWVINRIRYIKRRRFSGSNH